MVVLDPVPDPRCFHPADGGRGGGSGDADGGAVIAVGAVADDEEKSFKGTIDFKEGAKKAVGEELEKCIILSKSAKSKSLPMLLCHEEDVVGAHGVSSGSIEKEKLFYLMSRGLTEKEAKNLIIKSNFNKLIENVPNKNIQEEIIEYIDKKLK